MTMMDQMVKGVPIQVCARIKANNGFQKTDLVINNNKVGLVDNNNRLRDEIEVSEAFNEESTNESIFQSVFPHYINAFVEGVNVSVFFYGSSDCGKSFAMQGSGPEPGLVTMITDALYQELDAKKMTNPSFKF